MTTAVTMTVQITIDIPDELLAWISSLQPKVVVTDVTPAPSRPASGSASRIGDEAHSADDAVQALPADVRAKVDAETPQVNSELYRQFLERCAVEIGARTAVPSSGSRPYVNIFPPPGRRGGRLAALNLTSGRVHTNLAPTRVGEWVHAEVVYTNGQPDYLKTYLTPDSAGDAFDMVRAVLADR